MAEVKTVTGNTYHLTRAEMETIIIWNEEDEQAEVSTWSPTLIRKLDGLCQKSASVIGEKHPNGCPTYVLPKKYIRFILPRQLSEETKEKMKLRMSDMVRKQREAEK